MRNYRCISCGKLFDPEQFEICPKCGAAVAPSVMTRLERKHTAQRLRAEGKTNYDEHCHEDDAWKGSYGAGAHRLAVRAHESNLREGYAAHSPADNPNANPSRVSNANPNRASGAGAAGQNGAQTSRQNKLAELLQKHPALVFLIFLIPFFFALAMSILGTVINGILELARGAMP